MKTIVTHMRPDVDAVAAVWLLKRFKKEWQEANVKFVPAGETLDNKPVDLDSETVHVDTGLGRFDHHQINEPTCATKLVFNHLFTETTDPKKLTKFQIEALRRMVTMVNEIDHFGQVFWPNPTADYYDFGFWAIMDGWILKIPDDSQIIDWGMNALDGIYYYFVSKVEAEDDFLKGIEFTAKCGKGLGVESNNSEVSYIAQKKGYCLVVRKNPQNKMVSIKVRPDTEIDLTPVYNTLKQKDPEASWYLHISKKMLLNGSLKNPKTIPTKLTLGDIIEVVRKLT